MSTASIESLCAIAQTPMAKTLKFPQAKELGSHAMHPLQQTYTLHTPGIMFDYIKYRKWMLKSTVGLNQNCESVSV